MIDVILVINAGSSSIKFSVFRTDDGQPRLDMSGHIEGIHTSPHFVARDEHGSTIAEKRWHQASELSYDGAINYLSEFLNDHHDGRRLAAVGHRVVHGGAQFSQPVPIDARVLAKLESLVPLAPLHQPHNLKPIRIIAELEPHVPQIACFDTAFHCGQPEVAQAFALPAALTARGVRRYGFHGLSYEYIARELPRIAPEIATARVVIAHLGNGASMCAIDAGRSVANTMGYTALDGLPMGTRCGNVDPGVLLYLMDELGMDSRAIEHLLYHESGLLGVSGISSDMRTLLASSDPRARLAVDLFVYRIGRELGSLAATMKGIDAIVFTAGIGEHAAAIRERVCRDAAWLGVELDAAANEAGGSRISTASSKVSAWVIPTNEELMIAHHCRTLLAAEHSAKRI
jgi:acetate kinase